MAIRPGTGTGPPLLLSNGICTRPEALQPFVDAVDPAIEVVRFDAPGVGGSQLPNLSYRFTTLAVLLSEMLERISTTGRPTSWVSRGRRAGLAVHVMPSAQVPAADPGSDLLRPADHTCWPRRSSAAASGDISGLLRLLRVQGETLPLGEVARLVGEAARRV